MNGANRVAMLFAGTVVSLAIGALAGAGTASANEDDYVNDLTNTHIVGPRAQLLQLGYQACADKNQGVASTKSIANIRDSAKLAGDQADFIYRSAMKYLCGS